MAEDNQKKQTEDQIEQAKKILSESNYIIRTKDEDTQLFLNIEKEKKERYDAGYETAQKRLIVDNAKNFGIDLEGKEKNFQNFADLFKEKIIKETKTPVDKRISELEQDNAKLLQNYKTLESESNQFKSEVTKKQQTEIIRSKLLKGIPANVDFIIPAERIVTFAQKEIDFKFENDNVLIVKDGNIVKNQTTLQPVTLEDFIKDFSKDFVKPVQGGTGKKDEKPGGVGNYESFRKEMNEQGIREGSEKFVIEMNTRQKAGTLKI